MSSGSSGAWLFARYAYPPNKLGYCGPPRPQDLLEQGATADGPDAAGGAAEAGVRALARGFSGAWPYLQTLATLAGIDDPLDRRVVEAYWLGGGIAEAVDPRAFGAALLARIGPQAGHYWKHLSPEIVEEAAPNHCFHVFGVYPWSRLLDPGPVEQPLHVLEHCRIRWGTVISRDDDHLVVSTERLTWADGALGLSASQEEKVTLAVEGREFMAGVAPGEHVAVHWDWATGRLTGAQAATLRRTTLAQLTATNHRLARERAAP